MDCNAEYLKHEDCNFISVDWQKLAGGINYMRAVSSSTIVGELTGQLINFLLEQGADLNNFHVIGFSLGAHVAGKAGATANGLVPRITGNNLRCQVSKIRLSSFSSSEKIWTAIWPCSLNITLIPNS